MLCLVLLFSRFYVHSATRHKLVCKFQCNLAEDGGSIVAILDNYLYPCIAGLLIVPQVVVVEVRLMSKVHRMFINF